MPSEVIHFPPGRLVLRDSQTGSHFLSPFISRPGGGTQQAHLIDEETHVQKGNVTLLSQDERPGSGCPGLTCLGLSGEDAVRILANWLLLIIGQHPSRDGQGTWRPESATSASVSTIHIRRLISSPF